MKDVEKQDDKKAKVKNTAIKEMKSIEVQVDEEDIKKEYEDKRHETNEKIKTALAENGDFNPLEEILDEKWPQEVYKITEIEGSNQNTGLERQEGLEKLISDNEGQLDYLIQTARTQTSKLRPEEISSAVPTDCDLIAPVTRSQASVEQRYDRERSSNNNQPDQENDQAIEPRTPVAKRASPARLGTTVAGQPRQRMKWTTEMNEYIMRCYYNITKNEADIGAYRLLLHQAFLQKYPERQVTEQRIADQRRAYYPKESSSGG
ncbi:unnamed protein product [Psylliodes chrysocephalus]|uniref:Uncharacterized protein n=1 Tax=Psylliodes chrysocephalus TaxID=3402493 RepID=A0A9P0G9Q1_9CUCU|nr:unnamed protein product [Psylliodes chrysocephala]